MVRGITVNNVTFSNGSQKMIVEDEVGLWAFDSLKLYEKDYRK